MGKNLICIRGLQGSGKSTLASVIGSAICSADDFFIKNGKYQWDRDKLNQAHNWCFRKCELYMIKNISPIIVANTFVNENHLDRYIELSKKYKYMFFSIIVENRHGTKNIHGVPDNVIEELKLNFNIKL